MGHSFSFDDEISFHTFHYFLLLVIFLNISLTNLLWNWWIWKRTILYLNMLCLHCCLDWVSLGFSLLILCMLFRFYSCNSLSTRKCCWNGCWETRQEVEREFPWCTEQSFHWGRSASGTDQVDLNDRSCFHFLWGSTCCFEEISTVASRCVEKVLAVFLQIAMVPWLSAVAQ